MKHYYFLTLLMCSISLSIAQTPEYIIEDVELNGQTFKRITGNININETLDNSSLWIIADSVTVAQQTKLTITEGTEIFAETPETILYVNQLAEVDWQGTSTEPIVFNSLANAPGQGDGNDSPGQWLGIRIDGDGANSNSGIIRYIRQMYAGFGNDGQNAFQLENVGSGTTLEYLQVYKNANRSFRLNGGDAKLKYLVSTNSAGIGFRIDAGFNGSGQFWVINKDINAGNAIEGRGGNPILSNITVTGVGFNDPTASPLGGGIRIRNGGNAQIYNAVVVGVDRSIMFSDGSEQGVADGISFFRNSASFDNNVDGGTGFHSTAAIFNPTNGNYNPAFNNSVAPFSIVDSYVGTSTSNSTPAGALNPFFTDVNYVGAVQEGNDWTVGWCLNLDGTLRESNLSVNEFEKVNITVFPNPVQNNLTINSKININAVSIYNSTGRLIYENFSFNNENNQLDLSEYQSGIYFLRVTSGNFSQTLKVIKQ